MPVTSLDIASPMGLIYDDYNSALSWVCGIVGVFIGVCTIAWDIVAIAFSFTYATAIGYGLWSGVIFIVTGVFGISAGQKSTSWKVITFMSLSIASSICAAVTFSLGVVDAVTISKGYPNACWGTAFGCIVYRGYGNEVNVVVAMTSLLAAMGGLEAIVAILGAHIGCKVACCGKSANAQVVQYVQRT